MKISKSLAAVAATTVLSICGTALAYIPPSGFLVKTFADRRKAPKGVRVRTVVTAIEADQPTSVHFRVMTVFHAERGVIRGIAFDDVGQQLYVHERRIVVGGDSVGGPAVSEILFDPNVERVSGILKTAGIPLKTVAEIDAIKEETDRRSAETMYLSRWKKSVAWVVGVRKDPKAQLWVEKDTFLPVRFTWNGFDREMQFETYRFMSEFPFPRVINFLEKNKLVFREELTEVNVNPVAEVKALMGPVNPGFTDAGKSASGSVRDLIRLYFEVAR